LRPRKTPLAVTGDGSPLAAFPVERPRDVFRFLASVGDVLKNGDADVFG